MNILVTGATGYIGNSLAHKLVEQGYSVRCMVRKNGSLPSSLAAKAIVVEADALDKQSLTKALEGIDIAYYLIHSMGSKSGEFADLDRTAADNFGKAASRAGVKRIIYLGGLGSNEDELSGHLKSRHETGNVLRQYGVPITEFRAGSIIGSGSLAFEMIRYLVERIPLLVCPKWIDGMTQPIAIEDVLRYLVDCLRITATSGKILEIGGADKLSYNELMMRYAHMRGLHRKVIRVPVLTPRLSSHWIGLVTPLPTRIAKPLVRGLKAELYCRDERARELFDFTPMGFDGAVEKALTHQRREMVFSPEIRTFLKKKKDTKRGFEIIHTEGAIVETWKRETQLTPEELFSRISKSGGENGWPSAGRLWRFRMFIERLFGGSARPQRITGDTLKNGDNLDFWRVERVSFPNLILLKNEDITLPGQVWLKFEFHKKENDTTELKQTVIYEPKGLLGVLYYHALKLPHKIIYTGFANALADSNHITSENLGTQNSI